MPAERLIILDSNVLFSSLLRSQSTFTEILLNQDYSFFVCELVIVELFKYNEKIVSYSQLSEEEIIRFYYTLMKRINLYKEDLIAVENWKMAHELCKDVDETDTPHIALTLQLNGLLWTGDKKLKEGLAAKGFGCFFEPK